MILFGALRHTMLTYKPQRAGLLTYLYGIARNVTRNRLRRDRRFVALDAASLKAVSLKAGAAGVVPASDDPHDAASRAEERAMIRRAVLSLLSQYREVILL